MNRLKKRGFTLIEILAAIAIIILLVSIVLSSSLGAKAKARDAQRVQILEEIGKALGQYQFDQGEYPIGFHSSIALGWNDGVASSLGVKLEPYIDLQLDPINGQIFRNFADNNNFTATILYLSDGDIYDLAIYMETNHILACPNGTGIAPLLSPGVDVCTIPNQDGVYIFNNK